MYMTPSTRSWRNSTSYAVFCLQKNMLRRPCGPLTRYPTLLLAWFVLRRRWGPLAPCQASTGPISASPAGYHRRLAMTNTYIVRTSELNRNEAMHVSHPLNERSEIFMTRLGD